MEQRNCDLLCTNKATRRFGKLFICDSCASQPEDQFDAGSSVVRGSDRSEKPAENEVVIPAEMPPRRLYSSEDLADARRFLSNMRPRTSWDGDEEEFMANAAHRLYDVQFVGRFAQRVDRAIAHYHARVEKAHRLAQQRASRHNSSHSA